MASSFRARMASKLSFGSDSNNNSSSENSKTSSKSSSPTRPEQIDFDDLSKQKYLLKVAAGPSYDASTHVPVPVNAAPSPVFSNDSLSAIVRVRIRDFAGLPAGSPSDSTYFTNPTRKDDRYSISFAFVPKRDIPSEELVWGNDFDHPIRDRLPPGFNMAFRIVKEFIDPGLSCDAYADQPWLYGPALSCWFSFTIGRKLAEDEKVDGALRQTVTAGDEVSALEEGGAEDGKDIRANLSLPADGQKRRKFFLSAENRQKFTFEKGRLYEGDFFNPYLDFSNFSLKLPGFSLGVTKYIDDKTHNLRYVFKDRSSGELLFCVVFTLLFGEELETAVKDEQKRALDSNYDDLD